jgi:antagonist of KipI
MSLRIIKAGILDTIQDEGRYGYQHLGINPGGTADRYSAQLSNALLGKALNAPVLELHFPAARILFTEPTILCITGADFAPTIHEQPIPLNHPVAVDRNTTLQFKKPVTGNCCYLSVLHSLQLDPWLQSFSTNLKVCSGGYEGRALKTGDELVFSNDFLIDPLINDKVFSLLPWHTAISQPTGNKLNFIIGSEWHWLTEEARESFQQQYFQITSESDRMGYRLQGPQLCVRNTQSLVSSGVSYGTVQLLPNGQLIVLMADHQTTGGYPKIAHIVSADLSLLAQKHALNNIAFRLMELEEAEKNHIAQQKMLLQLQNACKFKIENLIHASL